MQKKLKHALNSESIKSEIISDEVKRGFYTTLNHTEEINYYRVYHKEYNINYI